MEVVLKKREKILFPELRKGNVFEYGGNFYIKTEDMLSPYNVLCNAVCLEHGGYLQVSNDEEVTKINGTFFEE